MTLHEVNEATTMVYQAASPDANIIFGAIVDENLRDAMRVTIIATGFDDKQQMGAGSLPPFDASAAIPSRPQPMPQPVSQSMAVPEVARSASGEPQHHISQSAPQPVMSPIPTPVSRPATITPAPQPVPEQKPELPPFLQKKRGLFD